MPPELKTRQLLHQLKRSRLKSLREYCGMDENPGIDEIPEWQIFTNRYTTEDQLRIECYLDRVVNSSSSILHIGVGNSSLALKFGARVNDIFGTTLHIEEQIFAQGLNILNYKVDTINKYSIHMDKVTGLFDFVVDNNPSSFACCLFHFSQMMISYTGRLSDCGQILTAQPGLGWVVTNNDRNWSFSYEDWKQLGDALELEVKEVDDLVYSMKHS